MAQDPRTTPEKQLLNLIEGASAPGGASKGPERPGSAKKGFSLSALRGALIGRLSFFKRSARKQIKSKSRFSISFAAVNKFLAIAAVVLVFYVATDITFSVMALSKSPNFIPADNKGTSSSQQAPAALRDQAYYFQKIAARDIFKGEAEKREKKKDVQKSAQQPAAGAVFKDLSLVGISWSSNPDAIIEDKQKQKTYFIKRGQLIGEGIKVESILKDKVILSYDGEEFELK